MKNSDNIWKSNNKGQVFVIGIVIIVTFGLISSLIIMGYLYGDKTEDEHIGTYQSGMIDAIIEGDKVLLYIDELAKPIARDALVKFLDNGGIYVNEQASDPGEGETVENYNCGKYVYNLWNSESKNCFPGTGGLSDYVEDELLSKLSANANNINFQRKVEYDTYFESSITGSIIHAVAQGKYDFYVYKNNDYRNDASVQQYAYEKLQSVSPQGDIRVTCSSGQCVLQVAEFYYTKFGPGGAQCSYSNHRPTNPYEPRVDNAGKSAACTFDCSGWIYWVGYHSGIPGLDRQLAAYEYMLLADKMVGEGKAEYICGDNAQLRNPDNGNIYYKNSPNRRPCTKDILLKEAKPGDIMFNNLRCDIPARGKCFAGHIMLYAGSGEFIHDGNPTDGLIKKPLYNNMFNPDSKYQLLGVYRFKYTPGGATTLEVNNPSNVVCQTTENDKWKITNVKASTDALDGSKEVEITMTIENKGDCVTIINNPKIEMYRGTTKACEFTNVRKCEFWPYSSESTNVYKSTKQNPYDDLKPLVCTFDTDPAKVKQEQEKGNCILLAPKDDSKIMYKVIGHAKDAMGRNILVELTKEFTVSKPDENPKGQTGGEQTVTLDPQSQAKYDSTKKNLQALGVLDYVAEIANIKGIPPAILLALITQESGGNIKAGSTAGAYGLTQVVISIHKNSIVKECGSVNNFQNDAKCQIRVGAGILKAEYDRIKRRTVYYSCPAYCYVAGGSKICQEAVDKEYKDWAAALRRYNGGGDYAKKTPTSGCAGQPDFTYVENVMRFAGEDYGGIISAQQQVALEEIKAKGIIGTYSVYPSFNAKTPFDLNILSNLSWFMNYTADFCRTSNESKIDCLQGKIDEFNINFSKRYVDAGIFVNLSTGCDIDDEVEEFYGFIESVENCAASSDIECQCPINHTGENVDAVMEGKENSASFTFTDGRNNVYTIESNNVFRDANNKPITAKNINLKDFSILKKLDHMKTGYYNNNYCQAVKNKYRMCLETGYEIPQAFGNQILYRNVSLKFAITIRDNIPPVPVTNVDLLDKAHSKNSLILSFDKNPEGDVVAYLVYLGNSEQDFAQNTTQLKKVLPYRNLNLETGYANFKDMDLAQEPECELAFDPDGQHCNFKYAVKASDGSEQEILLEENKLYYLEDKKRFVYVINGTDPYNKITDQDKFIAVTAADIDGNEIDNIQPDQKIELNKNLKSMKPEDDLEPGFVLIRTLTMAKINNYDQISLAWDKPKIYLDGASVLPSESFDYRIYIIDSGCNELSLCDVTNVAPNTIYSSNTESTVISIPSIPDVNFHTIVVTAIGSNGKEFGYGIARMVS